MNQTPSFTMSITDLLSSNRSLVRNESCSPMRRATLSGRTSTFIDIDSEIRNHQEELNLEKNKIRIDPKADIVTQQSKRSQNNWLKISQANAPGIKKSLIESHSNTNLKLEDAKEKLAEQERKSSHDAAADDTSHYRETLAKIHSHQNILTQISSMYFGIIFQLLFLVFSFSFTICHWYTISSTTHIMDTIICHLDLVFIIFCLVAILHISRKRLKSEVRDVFTTNETFLFFDPVSAESFMKKKCFHSSRFYKILLFSAWTLHMLAAYLRLNHHVFYDASSIYATAFNFVSFAYCTSVLLLAARYLWISFLVNTIMTAITLIFYCTLDMSSTSVAMFTIVAILTLYQSLPSSQLNIDLARQFTSYKKSETKLLKCQEKKHQLTGNAIPRFLLSSYYEIVSGLKDKRVHAEFFNFQSVTVVFGDIVGFTKLSTILTTKEMFAALNDIFGEFDKATEKYNCTRVRILGDAYYAVCGLPPNDPTKQICNSPNHAVNGVLFGVEMVHILENYRLKMNEKRKTIQYGSKEDVTISMRIGVNSGKIVAGLIGKHKLQFDIFGKDVTMAECLESSGRPLWVHAADSTKQLLDEAHWRGLGKSSLR